MIYMVEMDFPHPERLAEWHEWYLAHVRVLRSVPGFRGLAALPGDYRDAVALLALHEVASPAVFESPEYRARGGPASTGEWRALQTNWHRNLLDGLDETPEVPPDRFLVVLRDARDAGFPVEAPIAWLRGVGLDGTAGECGLAIVADPETAHRDRPPQRAGADLPADQRKIRAAAAP